MGKSDNEMFGARQFARNFNTRYEYHPSNLRVMRMFLPLIDKIDDVNVKKLKDIKFSRPRDMHIPKALQPIVTATNHHKRIPHEQSYAASKYIAKRISPRLYKHIIAQNKDGKILDEAQCNEFDDLLWETHIDNNYTADDIISILHEAGHEYALLPDILREIPSITTELLTDKILEKYGIPAYMFMTAKARRIKEMVGESYALEFITELFQEYEDNGKHMTPQIAKDLCFTDMNALKQGMMDEVPYFIGSASSLVLTDNIRDSKDYEDTMKVFNTPRISKEQKLRELNITANTLVKSFDNHVEYGV